MQVTQTDTTATNTETQATLVMDMASAVVLLMADIMGLPTKSLTRRDRRAELLYNFK